MCDTEDFVENAGDQLKPGDFIKVKVPKENGTAVDFIAQVTQQTDGTITGRYLKPWGTSSWKFSEKNIFDQEYLIPTEDIEKRLNAELHDDGRNIYYTFSHQNA